MADTVSNDRTTIKIGTRVRHRDDGVTGRIVWANAAAVKIQWDDGEKVTCKRAELGDKGVEIIESEETPRPQEAATSVATESAIPAVEGTSPRAGAEVVEAQSESATAPQIASSGDAAIDPTPGVEEAPQHRTKRTKQPLPAEPKASRVSALDAAARVLGEEARPMTCQEMIQAMSDRGYWSSPGGKTPAATLYSAILRELQTKPGTARFVKSERGKFTRTGAI